MKGPLENPVVDFKKIIRKLANDVADRDLKLELEIHKKLLSIFQVGDYYYYIFNLRTTQFDFMSEEVETLLGYAPSTLTPAFLLSNIHPEDVPWFLNFENKVVQFFSGLRADQIPKYKVRYDYRIKKANGDYIRILQQVITLQFDEQSGGILRTFGVHTDISHLKAHGNPVFSLIGLEGEPSYIDIAVDNVFEATSIMISDREREILQLLIAGMTSKSIAEYFSLSADTIKQHRKNMLRKTGAKSTADLVAQAVKKGWL
jgi:DNA-binding CsgD family transcriptional regulator